MGKETEYRFLVNKLPEINGYEYVNANIIQGYLSEFNPTIRIRLTDTELTLGHIVKKAYITVKGPKVGMTCSEYEYEIPYADGQEMLKMCFGIVTKTRFYIPYNGHTIELDAFSGVFEGLIIAEIEVADEQKTFDVPSWFGRDISADNRYSNVSIAMYGIPRDNNG